MKIIGFVGPKGSGKDTAADLLKELKKSSGKLSFAGPLKELCSQVFDVAPQLFHDPVLKERAFKDMKNYGEPITLTSRLLKLVKRECSVRLPEYDYDNQIYLYNVDRVSLTGLENRVINTPRELLQVVGTDFIRDKVYNEWHMRAAFSENALEKLKDKGIYCVTDIRFANEYEFLKEKFGDAFTCYYVERPEAEERLAKATHESETGVLTIKELLDENAVLKNDGTMEDFKAKLKKFKESKTSSKGAKPKSKFVYGPANG